VPLSVARVAGAILGVIGLLVFLSSVRSAGIVLGVYLLVCLVVFVALGLIEPLLVSVSRKFALIRVERCNIVLCLSGIRCLLTLWDDRI
jgi:hypothetical protein